MIPVESAYNAFVLRLQYCLIMLRMLLWIIGFVGPLAKLAIITKRGNFNNESVLANSAGFANHHRVASLIVTSWLLRWLLKWLLNDY